MQAANLTRKNCGFTMKVQFNIVGELINRLRGSWELRPVNLIWVMPT